MLYWKVWFYSPAYCLRACFANTSSPLRISSDQRFWSYWGNAVYTVIQNERNDDLVLYSAVEYAATIDVEPSSPRCANRQEQRANVPANSIDIPLLALLWPCFPGTRWSSSWLQRQILAQYLIPFNLSQLSDNRNTEVSEAFKDDIPVSAAVYHNEVKRWVTRCSLEDPEHVPSSLQCHKSLPISKYFYGIVSFDFNVSIHCISRAVF